jgi:hypothetical protein
MPTPTVGAGLVVGVVLGVSLLRLGAYFVHRYMDLQHRKISRWFHQHALVVRSREDLEKGSNGGKMRAGNVKKRRSAVKKETSRSSEYRERIRNAQREPAPRDGDGQDNLEDEWADGRQLQPYILRPPSAHVQSTAGPRALGWEQYGGSYDELWYPPPPAVFQQVVPGTYYTCIPPRPEVATHHQKQPTWHTYSYNRNCGVYEGIQDERTKEEVGVKQVIFVAETSYP